MTGSGPAGTEAGLCSRCRHQRVVANRRGSLFTFCRRSETDPLFPRYPRLPVLRCQGYEVRPGDSQAAAGDAGGERPGA